MKKLSLIALTALVFAGCGPTGQARNAAVEIKPFGVTKSGEKASLYTLRGKDGIKLVVSDFGGRLVECWVPGRDGKTADVTLGWKTVGEYETLGFSMGTLIGRYGNRIAGGKFTLDGKDYELYCNNGVNHLHGGKQNFVRALWNSEAIDGEEPAVVFTHFSPDGEEGYPGTLNVTVTYALLSSNALSIHYEAETDQKTIVNLTNHAYFNLGGNASGPIFGQTLWMDAESYLAGDKDLIPVAVKPVDGTPFDFTEAKPIGKDFFADFEDLRMAGGYDHCFNFTGWKKCKAGGALLLRAVAYEPVSGRKMEMYTNQPCVQLYSANFLKNPCFPLRGGNPQKTQTAFCLETQFYPDAIHNPQWKQPVTKAGEKYKSKTTYRFSW